MDEIHPNDPNTIIPPEVMEKAMNEAEGRTVPIAIYRNGERYIVGQAEILKNGGISAKIENYDGLSEHIKTIILSGDMSRLSLSSIKEDK